MKVCLTFDAEHPDQPHSLTPELAVPRLLATLRLHEVEATFFMQGKWVRAYPDLARAIADDGHQIGNHSYSHAGAQELTPAAFDADVRRAGDIIAEVTGTVHPVWFRFPYGQAAHWRELGWTGCREVGWNVDSEDYKPANAAPGMVAASIHERILYDVPNIVLMHTWPSGTVEDLGLIIRDLKENGAEFGTLTTQED